MRKIEKHFNELMLIALVSFVPLTMTSCSEDECTENYRVSLLQSYRLSVTAIDLGGMNSNVFIGSVSGDVEEYQTTGDLNLNGYTLSLDNIRLTVVGNMNGNGTGGGSQVSTLGNSTVCVQGSIQNNPYYNSNDFYCQSLSTPVLVAPDTIQAQCGLSAGDVVEIDGVKYRIQY